MKRLKLLLQSKYLFKILTIIILLGATLYTNLYHYKSKYQGNETSFTGIVTKISSDEDTLKIEIKAREKLIITYNYQDEKLSNLSYGDTIKVKGVLTTPSKSTIPNTFNYQKYLYNKKIYYIVKGASITKIKNNNNYLYTIKNLIYKRIDSLKSAKYLKTFLLSDTKGISEETKETYRNIGISHLFSISGMHISLFTSLVYLYLDKITYKKKIKYAIVDIFLIFYLILLDYPSSLLRSTITYLLFTINKIFKLKIKRTDLLLLTLIIALIINPFLLYDIGFQYSYIVSFSITIFSPKIKSTNKLIKIIIPIFISFLSSFPLTIYYNYEINFLSILANIIFVPLVSFIIFPLSLITFIFPTLDDFLFLLTSVLETISSSINRITFGTIIFAKPPFLIVVLYYLIIFLILSQKKYYYLLIIIMAIHKLVPYCNKEFELIMFDVGEADSLLIRLPYNKGNILIDTGNINDNYSKMESSIIPYLKSRGITKINHLIITHGDQDHIGGAIPLINNFNVSNVILNKGDFTDLEKNLISVLDKKNIPYISNIDKLKAQSLTLYLLNNKIFDNENDNSIIIYFSYHSYKFLMMGDASWTTEEYLIDKYYLFNISFLKVGHHGSSTSSSPSFIKEINPKVSLISVGKNFYGHPKEEVLNTLSNSKIYRTDKDGSIEIKINKNKCKIRTTPS